MCVVLFVSVWCCLFVLVCGVVLLCSLVCVFAIGVLLCGGGLFMVGVCCVCCFRCAYGL